MRRIQLLFNIPKLLSILLVLCITATLSVQAAANSSEWAVTNETKVRLISGLNSIDDSQEIRLGIQFQMKPGWKIYWRSPGDAGFPPKVEWVGSQNLDRTNIFWPVPLRFSVQGLETLGYKNEIVLPVNAKSKVKNKALHIRAQVKYVTCNDICIPYEAKLALKLPNGEVDPTKHLHLIETFRAKVPGNGLKYGLKLDALHSVKNPGFPPRLQLIASAEAGFSEPDVFIEGMPGLAYTKPTVTILDDGRRTLIDIGVEGLNSLDDRRGQTLDNRTFKITLVDGKKAIEAELIARAAPSTSLDNSTSNSEPGPSLAIIIIFAIIGGLILNLMPCVLPVLSLKVLSLIQYGGGEPREVRISFLSSAAGIFVAFLILAATLSSLKMGGMAIGWGIQFQQPWFLIALALLITIFACNFWGFFEIHLPQSISDIGVKVTDRDDFSRHFLQGAFATLLATPCSAPFVGTAVGFALMRGASEIILIFAALGLGLALPYLAFALYPAAVTKLPKPGPWVVKLKIGLGFTLAATGLWILSLLVTISGVKITVLCAGLMVIISIVLLRAHREGNPGFKLSAPIIIVAFLFAILLPQLFTPSIIASSKADNGLWKNFDERAIPNLVAAGKTVFVDVTADWCITCLANKKLILNHQKIRDILSNDEMIAMQADWTKPNDNISRFLARYNRYGIPFNIVYGPKRPNGLILPEILSLGLVLNSFGVATGNEPLPKSN